MKRTGFIKGTVKNNDNIPLKDITIMIESGPSHTDIAPTTGADGSFDFSNLIVGNYTIKAFGNGIESERIPVSVYPFNMTHVEIWLDIRKVQKGRINKGKDTTDIFPVPDKFDNEINEIDEIN